MKTKREKETVIEDQHICTNVLIICFFCFLVCLRIGELLFKKNIYRLKPIIAWIVCVCLFFNKKIKIRYTSKTTN